MFAIIVFISRCTKCFHLETAGSLFLRRVELNPLLFAAGVRGSGQREEGAGAAGEPKTPRIHSLFQVRNQNNFKLV